VSGTVTLVLRASGGTESIVDPVERPNSVWGVSHTTNQSLKQFEYPSPLAVKTEPTKPLLGFRVKLAARAGAEPTPDSTPASATTSATA
jgi:hypothetical protein